MRPRRDDDTVDALRARIFLLGVRIWLHYARYHRIRAKPDEAHEVDDILDGADQLGDLHGGGRGSSGSSLSDVGDVGDLGGEGGAIVVILAALVLAVAGSVLWLTYAAPAILVDAAFAALLSAELVRSARRAASEDWMSSAVANTWLAFTVVFAAAIVFALAAQHYFPEARTLSDVWRRL